MRQRKYGLILSVFMTALMAAATFGCKKIVEPTMSSRVDCVVVHFADPKMEAKVEYFLGKVGQDICQADCAALTQLNIGTDTPGTEIRLIAGIENCPNLTDFDLEGNIVEDLQLLAGLNKLVMLAAGGNMIRDISPLSTLSELWKLTLDNNQVADVSALSGLTNLEMLVLDDNQVSSLAGLSGLTNLKNLGLNDNAVADLGPLAGLYNLASLRLRNNALDDVSPLSGLTGLRYLYLGGNNISDISALGGLTALGQLDISDNNISDINALVANCDAGGLGPGDIVYLMSNPLGVDAITNDIPYLVGKGVIVFY